MRLPIVAAVLLSACAVEGPIGPEGPQGPIGPAAGSPIESGTRIKMRVGETPDGAKMFLGWHDAERGENCSFRVAADGKTRCLPEVYESGAAFTDENCAQRALLGPQDARDFEPPRVMLSRSGAGLGVFIVGAQIPDGVEVLRTLDKETGACRTIGIPHWEPAFETDGEITPSLFVEMVESVD